MTIDQAKSNIHFRILYFPYDGCRDDEIEYGMITSCNDKYVFVLFDGDLYPKATNPSDISLEPIVRK